MRKFRLSVLGKLYKSWERIFLVAIRATELFCSGQGAMAEAPNLEGILAPLLLRVARLEAHVTTMDLPFVEDRLDNMETVVAALGREFDALAQRLEELQRQIRRLEAAVCSLERERRSINDLADRISNLEIASDRKRREPWNTIRLFSRNWTIGLQALSHQPIQTTLEVLSQERHQQVCVGRGLIMLASVLDHRTVRPEVYVAFHTPYKRIDPLCTLVYQQRARERQLGRLLSACRCVEGVKRWRRVPWLFSAPWFWVPGGSAASWLSSCA